MANRHFAKIADVWKHLPLVEALAIERPRRYWESHAGSAAYPMIFDAERSYGVVRFVDVAPEFDPLASSRYLEQLRALNPSGRLDRYPGSALLAMRELGVHCSYLVCDLDEDSIEDLRAWAGQLGVDATVVADDENAIPKRTEIAHYTQAELDDVAAQLNGRPRQTLGWKTPSQALDEVLR